MLHKGKLAKTVPHEEILDLILNNWNLGDAVTINKIINYEV